MKIEFLNSKFVIKVSNFKKIFFAFYARFVDLIAFFEFTNNQKKIILNALLITN